jgi:hypothetical protein
LESGLIKGQAGNEEGDDYDPGAAQLQDLFAKIFFRRPRFPNGQRGNALMIQKTLEFDFGKNSLDSGLPRVRFYTPIIGGGRRARRLGARGRPPFSKDESVPYPSLNRSWGELLFGGRPFLCVTSKPPIGQPVTCTSATAYPGGHSALMVPPSPWSRLAARPAQ